MSSKEHEGIFKSQFPARQDTASHSHLKGDRPIFFQPATLWQPPEQAGAASACTAAAEQLAALDHVAKAKEDGALQHTNCAAIEGDPFDTGTQLSHGSSIRKGWQLGDGETATGQLRRIRLKGGQEVCLGRLRGSHVRRLCNLHRKTLAISNLISTQPCAAREKSISTTRGRRMRR